MDTAPELSAFMATAPQLPAPAAAVSLRRPAGPSYGAREGSEAR
ncbi:hypothetical protein PUR61_24890 [Streptomyces sp. BE20]|nr:hypothetical protein [Streptomyces sp. BE20]MEE1825394.1 hypothetical protein [Streptomyces sp. BE20]